jgi:hypothetical protein
MKKLLPVTVALLLSLALAPSVASAKGYQTTISKNGTLMATFPFKSFGNFTNGDCQYETAANLVLARWPDSIITTAEVLNAYRTHGVNWDPNGDGLEAGQDYLVSAGFSGHRAASVVQISGRRRVIYAADHGGVEVATTTHMFAMIRANSKTLTLVDDGFVYNFSWAWFTYAYSVTGATLSFYAVRWGS